MGTEKGSNGKGVGSRFHGSSGPPHLLSSPDYSPPCLTGRSRASAQVYSSDGCNGSPVQRPSTNPPAGDIGCEIIHETLPHLAPARYLEPAIVGVHLARPEAQVFGERQRCLERVARLPRLFSENQREFCKILKNCRNSLCGQHLRSHIRRSRDFITNAVTSG